MKILKMYLHVENKESNFHISNGTYNPSKLPKSRSKYAKASEAAAIW
jgi:hypothetical protein